MIWILFFKKYSKLILKIIALVLVFKLTIYLNKLNYELNEDKQIKNNPLLFMIIKQNETKR
jgi:hypothetical protein